MKTKHLRGFLKDGLMISTAHILMVTFLFMGTLAPVNLQASANPQPEAVLEFSPKSPADVKQPQLAADSVSRKPLELFFKEARKSGINANAFITALQKVGAGPTAVVETASANSSNVGFSPMVADVSAPEMIHGYSSPYLKGTEVQQAQIDADIASKKPLRLIFREARKSGISAKAIVNAMLMAGAAYHNVINAASAEDHSSADVVKTVLEFGGTCLTDLPSLAAAAIDTGLGESTLAGIAINNGCQAANIANALVIAKTETGAPVYGYSAPILRGGTYVASPTLIPTGPVSSTKPTRG